MELKFDRIKLSANSHKSWVETKKEIKSAVESIVIAWSLIDRDNKYSLSDMSLNEFKVCFGIVQSKQIKLSYDTIVPVDRILVSVEWDCFYKLVLNIKESIAQKNIKEILDFFKLEDYDTKKNNKFEIESIEMLMLLLSKLNL
ncbi:hypothetical protein D3C81_544280 [compost metagenome]